jgi:hypothetical protein
MVVYGLKNSTKILAIATGCFRKKKGGYILDTRSEEQTKNSYKCMSLGALFSRSTISVGKESILCNSTRWTRRATCGMFVCVEYAFENGNDKPSS